MQLRLGSACAFSLGLFCLATADAADDPLPKVRAERPRIFLRAKAWDGPAVEKIKTWMDRPEYKVLWEKTLKKEEEINFCRALRYVLAGDEEAGKEALDAWVGRIDTSPSYWGIQDQSAAALYDWLHDHPAFTPELRRKRLEQLEKRAERDMNYLKNTPENPFYSRFSGALAGLTACALAMHGDSPKAEECLRFAYDCLREKMGTIRQGEDGVAGGGSYSYFHEATDLANLVAAWRSATDWDAAKWIRENQGDWLRRQMEYQMWMTYPSGYFAKDGDLWGRDACDQRQYRMQIDAVTGMYRNGVGRTWADLMHKRWGPDVYRRENVWEFFVFNDPEVKPQPLADLGRAAVFGRELNAMVCWRSSWQDDATIIHFRAGEAADTHATYDQGKFVIYKQRPLAIKNGAYIGFNSPQHRYYKSSASANSVVFGVRTQQDFAPVGSEGKLPNINWSRSNTKFWPNGLFSWQDWTSVRDKSLDQFYKRKRLGTLLEHESNDRFARALADLSYTIKKGENDYQSVWAWTRELVFLDYKYLLVLDRVKGGKDASGKDVVHTWTLHTTFEPRIEDNLAVADNGPARLFCKTLLPAKAKLAKVGGPGHEFDCFGANPVPKDWKDIPAEEWTKALGEQTQMGAWRLDVTPTDDAGECTYLHVLFPTDTGTAQMPECSVARTDVGTVVKVAGLEYVFKRSRQAEKEPGR